MFHKFENRLTMQGDLVAETALRIGGTRSIEPTGTDLPVVKDVYGRPYIPGSSFRGVLRSRVEQIVRSQVPGKTGACNPVDEENWCVRSEDMERYRREAEEDDALTDLILKNTCLVCQLFGSPWFASRIRVRDLLVDDKLWFGQFQVRNGVAIDRDTETAAEGKLYSFEVVPTDTRFRCEIVVENAEDWQLGMLMMGLLPFERGEIALGGGASRGLGQVRMEWGDRMYFALNGDLDRYFQYIQGDYPGKDITEADDKGETMLSSWISAFKCRILNLRSGGGRCTEN